MGYVVKIHMEYMGCMMMMMMMMMMTLKMMSRFEDDEPI